MDKTKEGINAFIPFVKAVGRGHKLRRDLTYDEGRDAMAQMLRQTPAEAQVGAFLIAQRVKGEGIEEVKGFTDEVRANFLTHISPKVDGLLDLGVPYDGKAKTAQLAPSVAIALVSSGVPVILHGAENVPTKNGITPNQVLTALDIPTQLQPKQVEAMIEATGFGFADMAHFSPAWQALMPMRNLYGLRTLLNTIEKWFNPADAPYQISGFFHGNYIERVRSCQTGTVKSWMLQGEEGSIEVATGRRTPIFAENEADDMTIDSSKIGLPLRQRIELPKELAPHVALNKAILTGSADEVAIQQMSLTVGGILHVLGRVDSLQDGYTQTEEKIRTGALQATWNELKKV